MEVSKGADRKRSKLVSLRDSVGVEGDISMRRSMHWKGNRFENWLQNWGVVRVGSLVALAIAGCDDGDASQDDPTERIYAASDTIWDSDQIPVCWEDTPAAEATERGWVRAAVERTWQAHAAIEFTGWGECRSGSKGIRIRVADEWPRVTDLGSDLDGKEGGMVLNFEFEEWGENCQGNERDCIEDIAVHEFGHALGLAHEQNRPDTPSPCNEQEQGSDGDLIIGAWDLDSVMNYCNPEWNGDGNLSETDIRGIQELYGAGAAFVRLSNGSGFEVAGRRSELAGIWSSQKWLSGDFDGDGRDDLVNVYGNADEKARVWLHRSTGTGFEYQTRLQTMAGFWDEQKWLAGDFDGDGRDDLVNVYGKDGTARLWVHRSTGSGFEYQSSLQSMAGFWPQQKWMVGDFDADGRDDLVNVYDKDGKARVWVHRSTGSGFESQSSLQTMAGFWDAQKWMAGDFDGDGRDDLVNVYGKDGEARVWVHRSTGSGFESKSSLQSMAGFWDGQKWAAGDFTGDGSVDLINIYEGAGDVARAWMHASTGSGFASQTSLQTLGGFWPAQRWLTGDFDGDGQTDLVTVY